MFWNYQNAHYAEWTLSDCYVIMYIFKYIYSTYVLLITFQIQIKNTKYNQS